MKDKKSIIDTYSTLYNVDIVIANEYSTLEELKELFVYANGEELNDDILDGLATTAVIKRKDNDKSCILIKYNHDSYIKDIDKKADFINTISHEATHAALHIYEYIGQNVCFCSHEPFAWLIGFITECAYKTLKK